MLFAHHFPALPSCPSEFQAGHLYPEHNNNNSIIARLFDIYEVSKLSGDLNENYNLITLQYP